MSEEPQPHQEAQNSLGYRAGVGLRQGSGKAYGWFRQWLAKVWQVRGGGLYATGFIVTFVYLEITTLFSELAGAEGVGAFFREQLVEFIMRFSVESIGNTIEAFLWPLAVIGYAPPWGALALGLAFAAFELFVNERIERWLVGDEE